MQYRLKSVTGPDLLSPSHPMLRTVQRVKGIRWRKSQPLPGVSSHFALAFAVSTWQCQQTGHSLSRHGRRIKSQVAALPSRVQVTVVMNSGSVYRGMVNHLVEVVFWFDEQAQTQPVRISYSDVSKVKSANSNGSSAGSRKVVQHALSMGVIGCGVILMLLFL